MYRLIFLLLFLVSCASVKHSLPGSYTEKSFCDSDDYATFRVLPDTIPVRTKILYFTDKEFITPINTKILNIELGRLGVKLNEVTHEIHKDKVIVNTFKSLSSSDSLSDYFSMVDDKYNDPNYLNIYIVPKNKSKVIGRAKDIPSNAVIIREYSELTQVLIHELGHAFGLYHTHQYDSSDINTNYTGDRVCDTPICKAPIRDLNDSIYTLQEYNTLLYNYMSYPPKTIYMSQFTDVQVKRVKFMFENVPTLRKLISYD